jgi:hypothetical protein
MAFYFKPHTPEWFNALDAFDPVKAAVTKMVIATLGRDDVCSICGADPARDYQLEGRSMQRNAVATIRLCNDCYKVKSRVHREKVIPFG